jgi:LacI family transcriptional regulator
VTLPREAFGFAAVDLLLEEIAGTVGERHLVLTRSRWSESKTVTPGP